MYKCVFFDLDHTLWDYETNSKITLHELFYLHDLSGKGVRDFESFLNQFKKINSELWQLYDNGLIGSEIIRKERFKKILAFFDIKDDQLTKKISDQYLNECPRKGNLMPQAVDTLRYLSAQYNLSVITNGFEEIQHLKLSSGNLDTYFDHIITSQKAGYKKPAREIFQFALESNSIRAHEAVMVGDNLLTDIAGARNAEIDAVYYNPDKIEHGHEARHEINSLAELCKLL